MTSRMLPNSNLRPDDLSGLKVLVVDDHVNTLRLIGDVLRAGGVGVVETAQDGQRARDALRLFNPDIVFTDARMPVMDGLAFAQSVRRAAVHPDPKVPNPQVPIVMVTSLRSEQDVHIARRAGVNEFVIKPFTPAALLSRIQLVLRKPREFIISEAYVGPDRRRKVELNYSGPLRRGSDPGEVDDRDERQITRDTIRVELDATRRLIQSRGGLDRSLLQMVYRVAQHTRFRARQLGDRPIEAASHDLITYVEAMGGPDACDPKIIEAQFNAVSSLLVSVPPEEASPVPAVRTALAI
ncbi:MAG TPA: response regulator [Phenylobacterium sp.]|nr:response regulator [Phenylobacterium sp.]